MEPSLIGDMVHWVIAILAGGSGVFFGWLAFKEKVNRVCESVDDIYLKFEGLPDKFVAQKTCDMCKINNTNQFNSLKEDMSQMNKKLDLIIDSINRGK